MQLEGKIIEHCAPTLAGLKTANMFNYPLTDPKLLRAQLGAVQQVLGPRGVEVTVLRITEKNALLYVYRTARLMEDLKDVRTASLLKHFGYEEGTLTDALARLRRRLAKGGCFPHEIGLFLGYPPEDVEGFIRNGGKNCKCCGVWKVYCDESRKRRLFARFERCTSIYRKSYAAGCTLRQMTVPAWA